MAVGRKRPHSGHVFFDDGDEVVQFDAQGLPCGIVLADTTGSFADWLSPIRDMLPHGLEHVARHLNMAREHEVPDRELAAAIEAFSSSLISEFRRLKDHLASGGRESVLELFADRPKETGGIRDRVEGVVNRIEATPLDELRAVISESEHLAPFRVR